VHCVVVVCVHISAVMGGQLRWVCTLCGRFLWCFIVNKNTFYGTRYLSHCCSLHSTVVAVTWPLPCSISEIFLVVMSWCQDLLGSMLAKLEVWIFSLFGGISI